MPEWIITTAHCTQSVHWIVRCIRKLFRVAFALLFSDANVRFFLFTAFHVNILTVITIMFVCMDVCCSFFLAVVKSYAWPFSAPTEAAKAFSNRQSIKVNDFLELHAYRTHCIAHTLCCGNTYTQAYQPWAVHKIDISRTISSILL